jgi:hypothetical protein
MNRQRRRRIALLSPLVITSVAFAPVVAAHAASPESASAKKGGPSCELEAVGKKADPTYNLVLDGFPRNVRVQATSEEENVSGNVNQNGDRTFKDVEYSEYTVSYKSKGKTLKVPCSTPPPPKDKAGAVDLVDLDVVSLAPLTGLDCKNTMKFTASGVIKAKGKGTVTYQWATPGKTHAQQKIEFTGPEESKTVTKEFTIPAKAGAAAGSEQSTFADLKVTAPSSASANGDFKFKCA